MILLIWPCTLKAEGKEAIILERIKCILERIKEIISLVMVLIIV